MSDARSEILGRIRAALAETTPTPLPETVAGYRRVGSLSPEETLHLLKDRLVDYDAEVIETGGDDGLRGALADALQRAGEQKVLVAPEFPHAWLPQGCEVIVDHALSLSELDAVKTVITTCEAAIASTGTIVLVHAGAQGRRAITLLPDHHICVVRRSQIYELAPQAWEAIAKHKSMPMTTISGPSATSDIEMTRIRGVHGPRRLTVVFYA